MALVTAVMAYGCSRLGDMSIVLAEARIIKDLKNYILRGLMGKSMQFYADHSSGGLVAKSKRFAAVSESVIDEMVLSIIRSVILVGYLLVFVSLIIPKLTLVFAVWIIAFCTIVFTLANKRKKFDLIASNADSLTTGFVSDTLLSIFTLRIFSSTARQLRDFERLTKDEENKRLKSWFLGNFQWAVQSFLVLVLEFVCMYFVLKDINNGVYKVGMAMLVQSYIASLATYMFGLGRSITKVRTAFADAYEQSELLDEPAVEPIEDPTMVTITKPEIKVKDVSFAYDDGKTVLDSFSFRFEAGKSYGIIGKTGSGKSTLMKLLMHFYNPTSGAIFIDGQDIALMDKQSLRSLISFVPQMPHFPSITIREVIRIGKPKATEEEIIEAAQKACCDFIWEKPHGLDTIIGEKGIKLSGGEAQRLAIAAAILKDAPFVIMDEPTSALDAKTERAIQNAIAGSFTGKTMLVIAHRLSTVAVLGEILLLENGQLAVPGSHQVLLEISPTYQEMWELQTDPHIVAHE